MFTHIRVLTQHDYHVKIIIVRQSRSENYGSSNMSKFFDMLERLGERRYESRRESLKSRCPSIFETTTDMTAARESSYSTRTPHRMKYIELHNHYR